MYEQTKVITRFMTSPPGNRVPGPTALPLGGIRIPGFLAVMPTHMDERHTVEPVPNRIAALPSLRSRVDNPAGRSLTTAPREKAPPRQIRRAEQPRCIG